MPPGSAPAHDGRGPLSYRGGMFETLSIDVDGFHREDLPARLAAGNNELVAPVVHGLRPMTFDVDGAVWTYVPTSAGLDIVPGEVDGAARVSMPVNRFAAFVAEFHTAMGLLYGGFASGDVGELTQWEPVVRAAYHGRPPYDPGAVDLRGLDLLRVFELDDPLEDMAQHMRVLGYLHVRAVFADDEISRLRDEVERLMGLARMGDDRSWWAGSASGDDVLCRVTYAHDRSELISGVHGDPRLMRIVDSFGRDVVSQPDRHDGHSIVIKNPDITSGLSDLPWHVDCGLGGHPILCPGFNVGIQIDAATAETGQLHVLPGSHTTTAWHLSPKVLATDAYPTVALTTEPGDVTFHATDLLHAAPPPSGAGGRRALYVSYSNPAALDVIAPGEGYNDVVLSSGEGNRVRNLAET